MEEQKENKLMSEEEFKDKLAQRRKEFEAAVANGVLFLRDYSCVRKFKSVRRAIKRGHMSVFGDIYPKRPFGNTATTQNILKRKIYGELKKQKVGV